MEISIPGKMVFILKQGPGGKTSYNLVNRDSGKQE